MNHRTSGCSQRLERVPRGHVVSLVLKQMQEDIFLFFHGFIEACFACCCTRLV